jgi:hypothetical protein
MFPPVPGKDGQESFMGVLDQHYQVAAGRTPIKLFPPNLGTEDQRSDPPPSKAVLKFLAGAVAGSTSREKYGSRLLQNIPEVLADKFRSVPPEQ